VLKTLISLLHLQNYVKFYVISVVIL